MVVEVAVLTVEGVAARAMVCPALVATEVPALGAMEVPALVAAMEPLLVEGAVMGRPVVVGMANREAAVAAMVDREAIVRPPLTMMTRTKRTTQGTAVQPTAAVRRPVVGAGVVAQGAVAKTLRVCLESRR